MPGLIAITCKDSNGQTVPLVPNIYQSDGSRNPSPPKWVITGIDWDDDSWRNRYGNRIRQKATVTVQQYVRAVAVKSS
jgi:hypothetical protein